MLFVCLLGLNNGLRLGEGCLTGISKFEECLWQLLPNRCYVLGGLSALNLILNTMPNSETCDRCKGKGYYEALVSQHDDKKEIVKCEQCYGKGTVNVMTEQEERDYWEDYW